MQVWMIRGLRGCFAVLPTLAVAGFGILALGWLMLTSDLATPQNRQGKIGVIVPPWHQGGLLAAAGLGLPIIDLRWDGHLIILSTDQRPDAGAQLKAAGYFVINTNVSAICTTQAGFDV